jgi:predicted DNA binding CopG/RHH family protein
MATSLEIPTFATEAEEADWWSEHREEVEANLREAIAEKRTGRGTLMRRALEANSVLLDAEDITKAHAVAARKGLSYQAYVKGLVHEALEKESAA